MIYSKILNLILSAIDVKFDRCKPFALPSKVHIELNDFCNLRCTMCGRQNEDIPKNTGEISMELVRKLAPLFKKAVFVGLAGNGEPFMHSKIFEILEFIIKHKATPAVITNATLLNQEKAERLTKLGPLLLQPSIDSGVPEIYESIRVGAKFDKVRENLINLRKIREKNNSRFPVISIIACLMKETMQDIEKLVDFASEIGALEIVFQNLLPYNADMQKSLVAALEQGEEAVNRARKYAENKYIKITYLPMNFGVERYTGGKNKTPESDSLKNTNSFYCANIWNLFHVELTGKVRYCCFWSGEKLGDINSESPISIWKSERFAKLRKNLLDGKIPEYCKNCYIMKPFNKKDEISGIINLIKDTYRNRKNFR